MDERLKKFVETAHAGKLDLAVRSVEKLVGKEPENTDALLLLGMFLTQSGDFQAAAAALERAVQLSPHTAGYRNNLGNALLHLKKHAEAEHQFSHAISLQPNYHLAWLGLAIARRLMGRTGAALDALEQGKKLRPDWPELDREYGLALEAADRVPDAIRLLGQTIERHEKLPSLHSNYLMLLNYSTLTSAEIGRAHLEHARYYANLPHSPVRQRQTNRFRIGLLSGDLLTHSVGYFTSAILSKPPENIELFVYSSHPPQPNDPMQRNFRQLTRNWREVASISDMALSQMIRADHLDILLELSGHTGFNRLSALADQPAPKIMHAIGYPNTLGHPAIGYRLADSITDPPGDAPISSEKLIRVDPCFLCYQPYLDAPQPQMPEADQPLRFGCFNLTSKIGPAILKIWADLMARAPEARLVLKSKFLDDPEVRRRFTRRLAASEIPTDRVEILDYTRSVKEHLELYQRVHVALDTFPYNGTTTTCEALWMGVPVITLLGDRHAARVGASLLNAAGCPEWIARTSEEYIELALNLLRDRQRLTDYRRQARPHLLESALLDGVGYNQRFFRALFDLLQQ